MTPYEELLDKLMAKEGEILDLCKEVSKLEEELERIELRGIKKGLEAAAKAVVKFIPIFSAEGRSRQVQQVAAETIRSIDSALLLEKKLD